MQSPATAILLFSRTATAEAEHKSFGGGGAGRRVTGALISRAEATLRTAGLPVFRSDERSQVGATFGERLANAMARVYAGGFGRVLVVGNDCPSVSTSHLRTAAQKLAAGQNVLGPDRRGGVWLIGLQRADFDAAAFAKLPWESNNLYRALAEQLPLLNESASLGDLNDFNDLRQNWFFLRRQIAELFDLLLILETAFAAPVLRLEPVAVLRRLGRAPPC